MNKETIYNIALIIFIGLSVYINVVQYRELKPVFDCEKSLARSGEGLHRFKSETHRFNWCDAHRFNWKTLVTPRTLTEYKKIIEARAKEN